MKIKKFFGLILAVICVLNLISIPTVAETYDYKQEAYDTYERFVKALIAHNGKEVAKIIMCTDYKQFEYKNVEFGKDYKIELLNKSRRKYGYSSYPARITLNIKKSSNPLFPKGKQEYYADFSPGNVEGDFYLYSEHKKDITQKYTNIIYASFEVSAYLNDFKSLSENKIKNIDYNDAVFIHWFVHHIIYPKNKYHNGMTKSQLTAELNKFFGSKKQISKNVLNKLREDDGRYYKDCPHGGVTIVCECKRVTKNKKTGYYTFDVWFYSDGAHMNVCKKIKYTYAKNGNDYVLKKINCYYDNGYDVVSYQF